MGLIPSSGSEISMGKVGQAFGLGTAGTVQLGLNATLGPESSSPPGAGNTTTLSGEFGGQTTPNDYP